MRQLCFFHLVFCLFSGAGFAFSCQVQDDLGQVITLSRPVKRLVSLAPNLTELVVAAGATRALVGRDSASDYPKWVQRLPIVGNAAAVNVEELLKLDPDLILVWGQGPAPQALAWLQGIHPVPIYHATLNHLQQIPKTLKAIGCLADTDTVAKNSAKQFSQRLQAIKRRLHRQSPKTVGVIIWLQPLMVVGGKGFMQELLSVCRAKNVFAGISRETAVVSLEQLLVAHPDYWLTTHPKKAVAQTLRLSSAYEKRLVSLNPDWFERPSLRVLSAIEQICRGLHPAGRRNAKQP